MSTNKRRKPAGPSYPKPGLRLMKSSEVHPARIPEPDLARALEDLKRRYREWRVWEERDDGGKDAA